MNIGGIFSKSHNGVAKSGKARWAALIIAAMAVVLDRKSTRLNSSHYS